MSDGDIAGPNSKHTASNGLAPSAFDPSLEYSAENVVLFWQPPSYCLQWSTSSFCRRRQVIFLRGAVYGGRKARRFKDHRAVELIMSSPHLSTRKRIGRGVPNFDYAVWDRDKQNTVLASNYAEFMHAKFTQNPAMKHHPLSTGNKRLAEASPLGPDWGIGLRAGDPRDAFCH